MKKLSNFILLLGLSLFVSCSSLSKTQSKPSYLYVMSVERGTYQKGKIKLKVPSDEVLYFSDRPIRKSGKVSLQIFLERIWTSGKDSFETDPPNAAFSFVLRNKKSPGTSIVEISNPKNSGGMISFDVKQLEGRLPKNFGQSSLYIDIDVGEPYSDGF